MIFVHAVLRTEWESAILNGIYKGPTLETEGFIHCSPIHKIVPVANDNFQGVHGLILLYIEESKVEAEVRWEDLYNEGSEYPHIYGELNFDAVVKFVAFEPNVDGGFSLPQELAELQ
ncbi:DUF952 domain-containing protein [Paenibacillus sp. P32E]|uniref:DUF952 domain-containing protein n=1 Tax=Paenibacillus sp. P32E TaxID=1349434 RepID=UPI000938DE5F|nr:DUF952 domain-containing protein [Paenibacillus sp. P32E]OKP83704.1 hypothetical protein A3848_25830 [Paenibacillus sp. P32E]